MHRVLLLSSLKKQLELIQGPITFLVAHNPSISLSIFYQFSITMYKPSGLYNDWIQIKKTLTMENCWNLLETSTGLSLDKRRNRYGLILLKPELVFYYETVFQTKLELLTRESRRAYIETHYSTHWLTGPTDWTDWLLLTWSLHWILKNLMRFGRMMKMALAIIFCY